MSFIVEIPFIFSVTRHLQTATPSLVILYFSLRRRPARGRDHRVGQHRPQVRPRPPAPGRELPQGVGRHRERVLPQQRVR